MKKTTLTAPQKKIANSLNIVDIHNAIKDMNAKPTAMVVLATKAFLKLAENEATTIEQLASLVDTKLSLDIDDKAERMIAGKIRSFILNASILALLGVNEITGKNDDFYTSLSDFLDNVTSYQVATKYMTDAIREDTKMVTDKLWSELSTAKLVRGARVRAEKPNGNDKKGTKVADSSTADSKVLTKQVESLEADLIKAKKSASTLTSESVTECLVNALTSLDADTAMITMISKAFNKELKTLSVPASNTLAGLSLAPKQ